MASPHVAAAVANIISVLSTKNSRPQYTTDSIVKILQHTSVPYNNYTGPNLCTDNNYALDANAAIKYLW